MSDPAGCPEHPVANGWCVHCLDVQRARPIGPPVTFEPVRGYSSFGQPVGSKVRCSVCGRVGHEQYGRLWQESCLRGHRPCPLCGKYLTVLLDGRPRKHNRCPERTVHA